MNVTVVPQTTPGRELLPGEAARWEPEEDPLLGELDAMMSEIRPQAMGTSDVEPEEVPGLLARGVQLGDRAFGAMTGVPQAAITGGRRAILETGELLGEYEEGSTMDRLQDANDAQNEDLSSRPGAEGVANSLTSGVSQFLTGMVGVGKVLRPVQMVQRLRQGGLAGRVGYEVGVGTVAGALVFDPWEERLSDLVENYPSLSNPVTRYLAADPNDSAAEGRFKNALEGIGMDLALVGAFTAAARAIRMVRNGDAEGALRELDGAVPEEAQMRVMEDEIAQAAEPLVPRAVEPGIEQDIGQALEADARGTPSERSSGGLPTPEGYRERAFGGADGSQPPPLPRQTDIPEITVRPEDTIEPRSGADMSQARSEATVIPARGPDAQPQALPNEVPQVDVESIVRGARDDMEALQVHGSREAAIEAGYSFRSSSLPWQKLYQDGDIRPLLDSVAEAVMPNVEAITDAKVNDMVARRAAFYNEDPSEVMGALVRAGEDARRLAADMEASYLIGTRMQQDAYALFQKIEAGNVPPEFVSESSAMLEVRRRLVAGGNVLKAGQEMRATAGRTMRRLRGDMAFRAEHLEQFNRLDDQGLRQLLRQTQGQPKKLAQASDPSFMERFWDETGFLFTNNLLWNWPTHAVNLSTNLYMLGARPLEKILGSFAAPNGGIVRRQAALEYSYMIGSLGDAWTSMVEAFKRGDSLMAPHQIEAFDAGYRVDAPVLSRRGIKDGYDLLRAALEAGDTEALRSGVSQAALGAYRTGVGLPTRGLGAIDEFMKTIRYRGVVQAKAAIEGQQQGLVGKGLEAHIERRLAESFSADGQALDAKALQEAQIATFQQELEFDTTLFGRGGPAVALRNARNNFRPAVLILPFLRTPTNVLRYGIKMTPGLNMLQKEYRQMLRGEFGEEATAQAAGQMALGGLFMGLAASMALSGRVTGGGPSEPNARRSLLQTGWKPYSIVYTDGEGNRRYFPMSRFDPIGLPFGMVADIMDGLSLAPGSRDEIKSLWDAAGAVSIAMSTAIQERSFLQGINMAIQAMASPEDRLERWLGDMAGNLIPASSAVRNYANPDNLLRDARGIVDRAMRGVPVYSETIAPVRDFLGEPVWRQRGLVSSQSDDPLMNEYARIVKETGFGISPPPATRDGTDLREVRLADGRTAYDAYQQMVGSDGDLRTALERLVQSEQYAGLIDGDPQLSGTKLGAIRDVVSRFRREAFQRLQAEHPEVRQQLTMRRVEHNGRLRVRQDQQRERDQSAGDRLREVLGIGG